MLLKFMLFILLSCFAYPLKADPNSWVQTFKSEFIKKLSLEAQKPDLKIKLIDVKNELAVLKDLILSEKKAATQSLQSQLDQLLGTALELKSYPKESSLLVSLKADEKNIAAEIFQLEAQLELFFAISVENDTQFAGLEALRSVFKADLLDKIAEKHKLKSLLELLNGTEVISHPDLIAFIDKTVEPWGAMEVLTEVLSQSFQNMGVLGELC